ncbi:MAG: septum formation initiator family protein [Candidatus Liptonbacteria bacterium]|nr:septum formation initiator family protein [Candidatus Liptonbacteria bacterium]
MKIAALIFLLLLISFLVFQIYTLWSKKVRLGSELDNLKTKFDQGQVDQKKLKEELDYLGNPLNLEKELRARFNLKKPGEKMIILVPTPTSTTTLHPNL